MRPRLIRVERRFAAIGSPMIAFLIWGVLLASMVVISKATGIQLTLCAFRAFTGLPCPSCGSTRGVLRVLSGDLLGGILMNPLMMIGLVAIGVWFALRLIFRRRIEWNFGRTDYWIFGSILVLAVAANWIWVIRWHAAP